MYRLGIENYYFSRQVHFQWLLDAVLESVAVTFITVEALKNCAVDGQDAGLWMTGAHTFTLVVIIVNLKLLFVQHRSINSILYTILTGCSSCNTGLLIAYYKQNSQAALRATQVY
jgi:hypothetical protein